MNIIKCDENKFYNSQQNGKKLFISPLKKENFIYKIHNTFEAKERLPF